MPVATRHPAAGRVISISLPAARPAIGVDSSGNTSPFLKRWPLASGPIPLGPILSGQIVINRGGPLPLVLLLAACGGGGGGGGGPVATAPSPPDPQDKEPSGAVPQDDGEQEGPSKEAGSNGDQPDKLGGAGPSPDPQNENHGDLNSQTLTIRTRRNGVSRKAHRRIRQVVA